jgi:hypothetical protein
MSPARSRPREHLPVLKQPIIAARLLLSPSLKPGHPFDVPLGERIKVRGKISLFLGPLTLALSPAAKPFTSDERPSRGRGDRGGVAEFVFPSSSVFITPPWPSPPQWRCFLRAEVHRGGEGREGYTAVRDRSPIGHVNRTRQRPQQPGIAALSLLSPSLKPGRPFDVPLGERIKVRGKISLFLGPPHPVPLPRSEAVYFGRAPIEGERGPRRRCRVCLSEFIRFHHATVALTPAVALLPAGGSPSRGRGERRLHGGQRSQSDRACEQNPTTPSATRHRGTFSPLPQLEAWPPIRRTTGGEDQGEGASVLPDVPLITRKALPAALAIGLLRLQQSHAGCTVMAMCATSSQHKINPPVGRTRFAGLYAIAADDT